MYLKTGCDNVRSKGPFSDEEVRASPTKPQNAIASELNVRGLVACVMYAGIIKMAKSPPTVIAHRETALNCFRVRNCEWMQMASRHPIASPSSLLKVFTYSAKGEAPMYGAAALAIGEINKTDVVTQISVLRDSKNTNAGQTT